ncbi:MAG: hypothetical protein MUE81_22450, partial [Thermoflexibacter sp.]|nr:hypothetical protein [Thermoflexibacter sp.]
LKKRLFLLNYLSNCAKITAVATVAPTPALQLHCASCTAPPKEKGAKIHIYSKSFPSGGAMQLKDLDRGKRTI